MNINEVIITLLKLPRIGKVTTRKIIDKIYNPSITLYDIVDYFNNNKRLDITYEDVDEANKHAKDVLNSCDLNGINIVNYCDDKFPKKLLMLKIPPVLLYYKGDLERLNTYPSIAIVGSREPSNYGVEVAKKYTKYFVDKDINIISGLAKGIDSISHEMTVLNDGYAVAFVAQGLGTPIYPKESRELAEKILKCSGLLMSEYEPNIGPNRNFFVERDRLQCGASDSVLVIETDVDGGTMHAAKGALDLGRICAVLDHPEKFKLNNFKSRGNQKLINELGAMPVFDKDSLDKLTEMITYEHQKNILNVNSDDKNSDYNSSEKKSENLKRDQLTLDI